MIENNFISQERLNEISDLANENIEKVFENLGISIDGFTGYGSEIRLPCPLHDGESPNFCYNTSYKHFRCFSHQCHKNYYNGTVIGLVKGILSKNQGKEVSFLQSVDWLCKLLDLKNDGGFEEISLEDKKISKLVSDGKFKAKISTKRSQTTEKFTPIPIEKAISKLNGSKYFQDLGFGKDIQEKYYIGWCDNPNKPMYMRSYCLVPDEENKNIIGVSGRTIVPECNICGLHHNPNKGCPQDDPSVKYYSKWSHWGFSKSQVLYNSFNAQSYIKESGIAIVCEGPKDVWRLEQSGIHNSVCIWGLSLSDYHLKKLISMGTKTLIVALDNDERGLEAIEEIEKRTYEYFKLVNIKKFMNYGEDIADLTEEKLKEIKQFLGKL